MSKVVLKPIVSKLREDLIKGISGKLEKYGFNEDGVIKVKKPLSPYNESLRNNVLSYFEAENISGKQKYVNYIHDTARTFLHILVCFRLMESRGIMRTLMSKILGTDIYDAILPDFVTVNPLAYDEYCSKYKREIDELAQKDDYEENDEYYQVIHLIRNLAMEMSKEVPLLFKDYEHNIVQPGYDDLKVILGTISLIQKDEYDEDDFLGWIYQYWVDTDESEVKESDNQRNISYVNEMYFNILHLLQEEQTDYGEFYTPRWVVKYIVDKSIHEYRDKNDKAIENIKLLDPACGAGNFLVYAFDALYNIYIEAHPDWTVEKIIQSILEKNIYGVDIQREPLQITAINLWMKAKTYAVEAKISGLNLYNVNILMANSLYLWETEEEYHQMSLFEEEESFMEKEFSSEDIGRLISNRNVGMHNTAIRYFRQNFEIIVMNPPYLGIRKMKPEVSKFLKKYYPKNYINLFEAFLVRALQLLGKNGVCGFIGSDTFLTVNSHRNIRETLLKQSSIIEINETGKVFDGPTVDSVVMLLMNKKPLKSNEFLYVNDEKKVCKKLKQSDFLQIEGFPIILKITPKIGKIFTESTLMGKCVDIKQGMISGNNKKYLRYKWEVPSNMRGKRFFPYANGGGYAKYANSILEYIDWDNNGRELKADAKRKYGNESRTIKNTDYFFRGGVTYSCIGGHNFSARNYPEGCIFSDSGPCVFSNDIDKMYILGYMNSKIINYLAVLLNPSVGFRIGDVERIPFIRLNSKLEQKIIDISREMVEIQEFVQGFDYISDFYHESELEYGFMNGAQTIEEAYIIYSGKMKELVSRAKEKDRELNYIFYNAFDMDSDEIEVIEEEIQTVICDENDIKSIQCATFNYVKAIIKNYLRESNERKICTKRDLVQIIYIELERIFGNNAYKIAEEIETVLNSTIDAVIGAGCKVDGIRKNIYGKNTKDLVEPYIQGKIIGGTGKNAITLYWYTEHFILEYDDNCKYSMQNEIRRITDEIFVPTLIKLKEKESSQKEIELYETCIKTLENWKVVD
ncbi:MAG: N-6 DNA methylase [Eubacterium sp.]|nr:N-6 DNA methylase [Eubacterium sp.]